MAGPSHFAEVASVTFTPITYSTGSSSASAISLYSINSIDIRKQVGMVYGKDNGKKRDVSAHAASFRETVSINTNDIGCIKSLEPYKGTVGKLSFSWTPSANQLNSSALAAQTVTINNFVIESLDETAASKALGSGAISGPLLEMSDASDPITYT